MGYNPNEARVASGPQAGEWTSGDASSAIQKAASDKNSNMPLSEKDFYKKYKGQHKDLRATSENEANVKFKVIQEQGFKEGIGPNALPVQRYVDTSIVGQKYGNKKGDYVYLIPKESLKDTPNGLKVKQGYKPTNNERVKIEYDGQPTYEAYKNQFK